MQPLRPNESRARIAIIFIWITLGIQCIGYISDLFQLILIKSIMNGEAYDFASLEANDARQRLLAMLSLIALIVSGVTFIMWFRRAYYNLHILDRALSHSEGWAAGAWFVPIVSLWKPFQIMRELYTVTQVILRERIPTYPIRDFGLLLGWWWALWIINNFWGNLSMRLTMNAETMDTLLLSTNVSIWNVLVSVPLAILAVKVVREYSEMENLLATVQQPEAERESLFDKEP